MKFLSNPLSRLTIRLLGCALFLLYLSFALPYLVRDMGTIAVLPGERQLELAVTLSQCFGLIFLAVGFYLAFMIFLANKRFMFTEYKDVLGFEQRLSLWAMNRTRRHLLVQRTREGGGLQFPSVVRDVLFGAPQGAPEADFGVYSYRFTGEHPKGSALPYALVRPAPLTERRLQGVFADRAFPAVRKAPVVDASAGAVSFAWSAELEEAYRKLGVPFETVKLDWLDRGEVHDKRGRLVRRGIPVPVNIIGYGRNEWEMLAVQFFALCSYGEAVGVSAAETIERFESALKVSRCLFVVDGSVLNAGDAYEWARAEMYQNSECYSSDAHTYSVPARVLGGGK